jgi:hypothetical protein
MIELMSYIFVGGIGWAYGYVKAMKKVDAPLSKIIRNLQDYTHISFKGHNFERQIEQRLELRDNLRDLREIRGLTTFYGPSLTDLMHSLEENICEQGMEE